MKKLEDFKREDVKEGIEYIYCDHLASNEFEFVELKIYIGKGKRAVLCPACGKAALLTYAETYMAGLWYLLEENKKIIDGKKTPWQKIKNFFS